MDTLLCMRTRDKAIVMSPTESDSEITTKDDLIVILQQRKSPFFRTCCRVFISLKLFFRRPHELFQDFGTTVDPLCQFRFHLSWI